MATIRPVKPSSQLRLSKGIAVAAAIAIVGIGGAALWQLGAGDRRGAAALPALERAAAAPDAPRDAPGLRGRRLAAQLPRSGDAPELSALPDEPAPVLRGEERLRAQRALLETRFAGEAIDPAWGAAAERSIRDSFAGLAIAGAHLDEVGCRGTLCRLAMHFDSEEAVQAMADPLPRLISWSSIGFTQPDPADPLRYTLFFSRDQASFPRLDNGLARR